MAGFIFEKGEEVQTGSHGDTEYVYASGEPVPNTGLSDFVFESGVGFGGGLSYSVDGGPLQSIEPIQTAESVTSFYDYGGVINNSANHGYWEYRQTTIFVHEDTRDGTLSLVCTTHDPTVEGNNPDYQHGIDFSPSITGYELIDRETGDEYTTDHAYMQWNGDRTDGFAYSLADNTDITFTFGNHPDYSFDTNMDGWRILTSDGPTPDGGGVEYHSLSESLRIVNG